MGARMGRWETAQWWRGLGIVGLAAAVLLWLYAIATPGRQDSAVSVGSAFFSSGVVLLVGAHLAALIQRK